MEFIGWPPTAVGYASINSYDSELSSPAKPRTSAGISRDQIYSPIKVYSGGSAAKDLNGNGDNSFTNQIKVLRESLKSS